MFNASLQLVIGVRDKATADESPPPVLVGWTPATSNRSTVALPDDANTQLTIPAGSTALLILPLDTPLTALILNSGDETEGLPFCNGLGLPFFMELPETVGDVWLFNSSGDDQTARVFVF